MAANWLAMTAVGYAQISPDSSFGTTIAIDGDIISIGAGTQQGANLFHSFQEFSVPAGTIAQFAADAGIENIFSRVTGAEISEIDGTLRSPVSLFLINPNGISFGNSAALEVGGAFYATTADRVEFADGLSFDINPDTAPLLLSSSVPIGLGFGTAGGSDAFNTGEIVNRSQTIGVGLDGEPAPVGLTVAPTQALGLIGADVTIAGGLVTSIDGSIEVAAVADGVWSFGSTSSAILPGSASDGAIGGTVAIDSGFLNSSGLSGGRVRLSGADIALTDGAGVLADTFGEFPGGGVVATGDRYTSVGESFVSASNFGSGTNIGISLAFSESIAIDGIGPYVTVGRLLGGTFGLAERLGGLYALVGGTGDGGDIALTAPAIALTNGTSLYTTVVGFGQGGDIILNATDRLLAAGGSFVLTSTVAPGDAGDMSINAGELLSIGGGIFNTSPSGEFSGDGGDFFVVTDRLEIRDTPASAPIPGSLLATTLGTGSAGALNIETGELILANGGQLSVSSSGGGTGGRLNLVADTIEISGLSEDGQFPSGIFASSNLFSVQGVQGDAAAGSIDITARQLTLREGGQISAAVGNGGNAGDITLDISESIEIAGFATNATPSLESLSFGVFGDGILETSIEANTVAAGNAGNIAISTDRLTIRDGAEIGVRSTSTGDAGNLSIEAGRIELRDGGDITVATESGQGGNVALDGDLLILREGAVVSATAAGAGDGGNLQLSFSEAIVGLEGSTILAEADLGDGGQIAIRAPGLFLSSDSSLSASSNFGQEGTIAIRSPNTTPSAPTSDLSTETAEEDAIAIDRCRARSRFVLSGRGGLEQTPLNTMSLAYPSAGRTVPAEPSESARSAGSAGGEVAIREAGALRRAAGGAIELVWAEPTPDLDPRGAVCRADDRQG
ncbi:MAG: filamentous hemagglutinin N-terminal domain-containing protein [Geitlerinemataceae cyanobacterium]